MTSLRAGAHAAALMFLAVASTHCSGPAHTGDADPADASDENLPTDDVTDASTGINAMGGSVDLLRFSVFGDVRPPNQDDTANYPTAVFTQVVDGIASLTPQFAIATGDYMFASITRADIVNAQLDLLQSAEQQFTGHIFHAMGNHECTGGTASFCMNGTESANVMAFRSRLIADEPALYYDFTVQTSMGDAHFVATAPNAWSSSQSAWLTRVLGQQAQYTFVIAHEPPTSTGLPSGSMAIEQAITARPGGVTLRLYGHTHTYRKIATNAVITGNAGAPLDGSSGIYGFALITQRADGDIVVTQYAIGRPPMAMASFVVHPDGTQSQ